MAEHYPTGGKFWGGFLTGGLAPIYGTGIGYFIVGSADLDMKARNHISDKSSEYKNGFMKGWEKKTQSRKRGAFVGGGLLGSLTALITAVVLTALVIADLAESVDGGLE